MTPYAFSLHFTPEDKLASDYHYLPFEVPPGVSGINVRYDFTKPAHAERLMGFDNIIDIGLFDPRGHEFNGSGFRGWSGSARTGFYLSPKGATPGYLPGPIPAGTWHIILGLYQIAPEGCDCQVTVTLDDSEIQNLESGARNLDYAERNPVPLDAQTRQMARTSAEWYRGDLHTHTHHSDAEASVAEIARVARSRGLDFVAIADHNTISQHLELATHCEPDLLLMPAMELTTYYGHANVWGLQRWVDFRCRDAADIRRAMEAAHSQHALVSINHPNAPIGESWEYGWIDGADAIEVWHGLWDGEDDKTLAWWDALLQMGKRVAALGGSDRHQPSHFDPRHSNQVGSPATWVYAETLSTEAILAGMRAGHAFITADVDGPQVSLRATTPDGRKTLMGDALKVSLPFSRTRSANSRTACSLPAASSARAAVNNMPPRSAVTRKMCPSV